ncbi:MAG: DUF6600 domain-containing protein [Ignavibacteriaceae bacterium]
MKVFIKIIFSLLLIPFLFLTSGCSSSGSQSTANTTSNSDYNVDELNSYGEWVEINNYGRGWHPYVVNGWMPFDNGHWVYADGGNWTWASYEPFGWVVYHYGSWYDDPFYGWVWVPSNGIWTPANVTWINYGDYVGWAPLGPRGVVYGRPWEANQGRYWHVVRNSDFTNNNIREYRVMNPIRNENDNREVFNKLPDRQAIERTTGKPITVVKIQRENVKLPNRQIQKINLPPQEKEKVEQNAPRVKKDVLLPKEEFHKQQSVRNNRKK